MLHKRWCSMMHLMQSDGKVDTETEVAMPSWPPRNTVTSSDEGNGKMFMCFFVVVV